jgi:hypothetical protein
MIEDNRSGLPLKAGVYAAVSLAITLILVLSGDGDFSPYFASLLAITAAVVVWRSNRDRPRSGLITLFFSLAAAHAIFGYWAAGKSTLTIWIGSNAQQMFRRSFFVIAATLFVAALTYDVALKFPSRVIHNSCFRLQISEQRLLSFARMSLVLGCLLVAYVGIAVGFMPMLTSNPGAARYLSPDLTTQYEKYQWIVNLALDFLTLSVPLVLFSGWKFQRITDWLLGLAGVFGVLFTLRRANLVSVGLVLLLLVAFTRGRLPRRYLAYAVFLVLGYFASQLIFLNAFDDKADSQDAVTASLSGLPEVRDLGWAMSLVGDKRFYGGTFISLVPLLGRFSELKTQDSLVEVTKRLIGMEGEGITGGLRITFAGEGFLNFGALGSFVIGIIFGWLCSSLLHVSEVLLKKRDLASSYLAAFLFVWLCFWLYLAGTEATGAIRNGSILIFILFYLSRVRKLPELSTLNVCQTAP